MRYSSRRHFAAPRFAGHPSIAGSPYCILRQAVDGLNNIGIDKQAVALGSAGNAQMHADMCVQHARANHSVPARKNADLFSQLTTFPFTPFCGWPVVCEEFQ